ncbi:MAG: SIS domain-containing protein [Pseudonocardia sp.]
MTARTNTSTTGYPTSADFSATAAREAFARRSTPVGALAADAERLAAACHAMAERFRDGGRLVAFGTGTSAADAAHVVVEFVHPVIMGKRALPALALPGGAAGFAAELELFARPRDIALAFAPDAARAAVVGPALAAARERGLLTMALVGADAAGTTADHLIAVPSDDPRIVREGHVTAYHVLWELVHVFLEAQDEPGTDVTHGRGGREA